MDWVGGLSGGTPGGYRDRALKVRVLTRVQATYSARFS